MDDPSLKLELSVYSNHTTSKEELSELIVEEDDNVEGEGWDEEMSWGDSSGHESDVQEWGVAENGDQDGFEAESEVTETIDHTLLGKGEVSSLADHQISPLDTDDGYEVTGLSELEGFSGVANRVLGDTRDSVDFRNICIIWGPSALSP